MAKKKKKTTKKKVTKKKATKKAVKKKAPAKKVAKKKAAKKVAKKAAKKKATKKKVAKKKVAKKVAAKKVTKKAAPKKVETKAKASEKTKKAAAKDTPQKEKAKKPAPVKIQIQEDVILTDAEGRILCRVRDCDQPAAVEGYCRYHYLLFWRKIQTRKKILSEGKLEKYIEELTSRYPHKYLEQIKKDFSTEGEFLNAIQELEIDESSNDDTNEDFDEERSFIAEVRGGMDRDNDNEESEY